jgi:hypothetical protein
MKQAGLWQRQRQRKPYRKRRERTAHFGELVQMDGSFHEWLEERGRLSDAHGASDKEGGRHRAGH